MTAMGKIISNQRMLDLENFSRFSAVFTWSLLSLPNVIFGNMLC